MALAVTIIVLLILAAVAINLSIGNNGIITGAQNATEVWKEGQTNEQEEIGKAENFINNYLGGSNSDNDAPKLSASDIKDDPTYIGKEVIYTPNTSSENITWRIFYVDSSNIYLIASDYVKTLPSKKGEVLTQGDSEYQGYFKTGLINQYEGASSIDQDTFEPFLEFLNSDGDKDSSSMKATAYMLDKEIWTPLWGDNNKNAEYAIGVPTLDLFCKSYNLLHSNKQIEFQSANTGYQVKWQGDATYADNISGISTEEDLYIVDGQGRTRAMWLASPSSHSNLNNYIMNVTPSGKIAYDSYSGFYFNGGGFRPVICLKNTVKLQLVKSDGTYIIVNE